VEQSIRYRRGEAEMNETRDGFTLLEVVVALLLLTAGLLAVAGGTAHTLTQMSLAQARTARMAAIQTAAERVRAVGYGSLASACGSGSLVTGRYTVDCTVSQVGSDLKSVYLISDGPGLRHGRIGGSVVDTFVIRIAEPAE
jgi:prepilin-type N-terminal cleavage/methylation domain-containing protein